MKRLVYTFLLGALALAGCYQTGELGDAPFWCGQDYPDCPAGYTCVSGEDVNKACTRPTKCLCVRGFGLEVRQPALSSGEVAPEAATVAPDNAELSQPAPVAVPVEPTAAVEQP